MRDFASVVMKLKPGSQCPSDLRGIFPLALEWIGRGSQPLSIWRLEVKTRPGILNSLQFIHSPVFLLRQLSWLVGIVNPLTLLSCISGIPDTTERIPPGSYNGAVDIHCHLVLKETSSMWMDLEIVCIGESVREERKSGSICESKKKRCKDELPYKTDWSLEERTFGCGEGRMGGMG